MVCQVSRCVVSVLGHIKYKERYLGRPLSFAHDHNLYQMKLTLAVKHVHDREIVKCGVFLVVDITIIVSYILIG